MNYAFVDPSVNSSIMSFGANATKRKTTPTVVEAKEEPVEEPTVVAKSEPTEPAKTEPLVISSPVSMLEVEEYENEPGQRSRRAQPEVEPQPFSPIEQNQNEPTGATDDAFENIDSIKTEPVNEEPTELNKSGSVRRRRRSIEMATGDDDDLLGAFDRHDEDNMSTPSIEALAASPGASRQRQAMDEAPMSPASALPPRQGSLTSSQKQKNRLLDKLSGSFKRKK